VVLDRDLALRLSPLSRSAGRAARDDARRHPRRTGRGRRQHAGGAARRRVQPDGAPARSLARALAARRRASRALRRGRPAPAAHATGHPLQSTVLTISCHAYTHVDAPLHYLVDGRDMASMPVDQWVGDAAVVDLTHLGANGEVTAADLDRRAAHVRRGDIVLL